MSAAERTFTKPILDAAVRVASSVDAQVVMVYIDSVDDVEKFVSSIKGKSRVVFISRDEKDTRLAKGVDASLLTVPSFNLTRMGQIKMAFDMMCKRALSRRTKGEVLADKQMVQEKIADSWIEMEQFRLLVLRTAWRIDEYNDYLKVRKDIAAIKALMPKVYHDIVSRCLQIHGSLGVSNELPLTGMLLGSYVMGIADGPTEVHKVTVARQILRDYEGTDDLFPSYTLPNRKAEAIAQFGDQIEREVENW